MTHRPLFAKEKFLYYDLPMEFFVPNQNTQPIQDFPVFNNWRTIAEGWYFACPSLELGNLQVRALQICGQELVVYRGTDQKVRALDAYCPHMGTHFGVGKVIGNNIQCFFHHWQFNEEGNCIHIPCQTAIPTKAKVRSYQVVEKYNAIWINPSMQICEPLANFPDHEKTEYQISFGEPYYRTCHHHVTMINGIDPQHLKTVHNLEIEMSVDITSNDTNKWIDITLTGEIGTKTWKEKLAKLLLGKTYSYSMRYDHGNNGLLTLMKNVYLFGGSKKLPSLHMIFAYRPVSIGKTLVQPIYLTPKRKGAFGFLIEKLLIWLTKRAFFALQGEDGKVYENMRFFPANLLTIDQPVARYIQYVNKLKSSDWSIHGIKN